MEEKKKDGLEGQKKNQWTGIEMKNNLWIPDIKKKPSLSSDPCQSNIRYIQKNIRASVELSGKALA